MSSLFVPKFLLKDDIKISLTKGTDENGSPLVKQVIDTKCRLELVTGVTYLDKGQKATYNGKAYIFDHLDEVAEYDTGFVEVGSLMTILKFNIYKNPDATINHIVLELI